MKKRLAFMVLLLSVTTLVLSSCSGKTQSKKSETESSVIKSTEQTEEKTLAKSDTTDADKTENEEETTSEEVSVSAEDFSSVPKISKENYPKDDGSTATIPLSQALFMLSTGEDQAQADAAIFHHKTSAAYTSLLYDEADIVIAYEPSESVKKDISESDTKILMNPIGKDALVFIANRDNPVKSLTGEEVKDIYSGKIKNWSEVGGNDSQIIAFQRPEESGSQTLMQKLVMGNTKMADAPANLIQSEMGEIIESVASYDNEANALGYSVYYYARNMYEEPTLRFMEIDGVKPDNDSIRSGEYPYVNVFYVAIREDTPKNSNTYKLYNWLLGDDGQKFIESQGYVSAR